MRSRGIEYKVGLLIVAAIALFFGMLVALGTFSFGSGYTFYVDYNFSGNIQPGAPVKLSGIKVGKVESVKLIDDAVDDKTGQRLQVRLEVWVEDRVRDRIRQDAEFFINTAGVLGEQYLEIVPGKDFDNGPLKAGTIVRGMDPPRTDLIISRLYVVLDRLSSVLTDERDVIGDLLRNGAGAVTELNLLLAENREELGELIDSAGDLAGEAAVTLNKVNEGIEPAAIGSAVRNADRLLVTAETSLRQITPEASAFMKDATRVTSTLTEERIDKALAVADSAVDVTGRAGKLIDNVDGLVGDLRQGKGSVGALLMREELYADLREMIRDLKRNPWKFFWKE